MLKNKKLRGILQLTFSLAILVWLIARVGPASIVDSLADIHVGWYLFGFGLFLISVLVRTYRWYIVQKALSARPPFLYLLYLYFVGFFFNNFLPSGFGGDVVKVLSLRQQYGRGTEALSSVLMDRLTGLIGTALIALITLGWYSLRQTVAIDLPPALTVIIALITLGVPSALMVLRLTDPLGFLSLYLPFLKPITTNTRVKTLVTTIQKLPMATLLRAVLVSLPFTVSLVITHYAIARALSVDLPFYVFPLFVPIISIITLLPISFNGLGLREGVYQLLYIPLGVSEANAISMSLALHLLRLGVGIFGGILYASRGISRLTQPAVTENLGGDSTPLS